MTIQEYLEQNEMSARAFAEMAGINHGTISHFLSGRTQNMSMGTAMKIVEASGGDIDIKTLFRG